MTTIIPDQPLPRRSESGMTTRAINSATGVILAAMKAGSQTPTGIALALDSARLLSSPETAAEAANLRVMYDAVSKREHDLIGERDELRVETEKLIRWHREDGAEIEKLRAERDKALAQRNAVFATNEQLHAQVEEAGLARIQAENEARTTRAEAKQLRARVAELEARLAESERPADEDPIAYALTDKATALEEDVTPQVLRLRALLAEQRTAAEADVITRLIAPTQALRLETRTDG